MKYIAIRDSVAKPKKISIYYYNTCCYMRRKNSPYIFLYQLKYLYFNRFTEFSLGLDNDIHESCFRTKVLV